MKMKVYMASLFYIFILNVVSARHTILCYDQRVEIKCPKDFVLRIDLVFHGYDRRDKVFCSSQSEINKELRYSDLSAQNYALKM